LARLYGKRCRHKSNEENHKSSILDFVEILYNMLNSLMLEKGVGRFYE
jgi:hypothetical protein